MSHTGCEILGGWRRHIRIFGSYGDKHIAFALPVPKTAQSATAVINECARFLEEYPGSFCCYIKDKRTHKDTWRAFGKKLSDFAEAGGCVIELDEDSRVDWYGLAATINRIKNGDVNNGRSAVTMKDAEEFFRRLNLLPDLFPVPKPDNTDTGATPQPIYFPPELKDSLVGIIKKSPIKLLSVDKAISALARRKITISRNELLAFLDNSKASFRTYQGSDDVMIGLS